MPPLRILHVTPYYEDAWAYGGIPRLSAAMARGLAARGHHVTVCTTDACDAHTRLMSPAVAVPREASRLDVRIFPNRSNWLAYHYQFFLPRGFSRYLLAHRGAFDVAHVHAHHHLLGALAARHLGRAGVPIVLAPNGTAPRLERRRLAKWAFDTTVGRHVLPAAACVIAVSEAERRQLIHVGVPPQRIALVPNPLDLTEFAHVTREGRFRARVGLGPEPLVLYLGKLTPRKRLDVLVDAFAQLERPDARLVVAGNDMGVGRSLRRQIARLGLEARASLVGLLAASDRLEALADADVVAYPSRDEVFGLVPFEALLCGTPVVVADDSGCAEHARRMGGGLVVAQGNAAALSGALATILADGSRWRASAAEAALRVRAEFSSDVICERLERLYEQLADRVAAPEECVGS